MAGNGAFNHPGKIRRWLMFALFRQSLAQPRAGNRQGLAHGVQGRDANRGWGL